MSLGQPTFAHVHAAVAGHLSGRITVAHSNFDKSALAGACRVHERPPIEATWLDSVRVARRAWPELPNHRLNELARFLGVQHKHHDALSDARAAGMVIVRAIDHTGIDLAGWLTPARSKGRQAPDARRRRPAFRSSASPSWARARDGPLAQWLAAVGRPDNAASVGVTTALLVVSKDQPFRTTTPTPARSIAAPKNCNAPAPPIEIVTEEVLRARHRDLTRPVNGHCVPAPTWRICGRQSAIASLWERFPVRPEESPDAWHRIFHCHRPR